jgi:hypothetical protein
MSLTGLSLPNSGDECFELALLFCSFKVDLSKVSRALLSLMYYWRALYRLTLSGSDIPWVIRVLPPLSSL